MNRSTDAGAPALDLPAGASPAPSRDVLAALAAYDEDLDRIFHRLRGRPAADAAALVVSNLADYGFVWAVLAAAKSLGGRRERRRALRALAVAGVTSASVNAAVKAVVRRERPEGAAPSPDDPLPVRTPTSSSFPSGHTLAAYCTAIVLADSPAELAAFALFATAVAASRVHLRAHHGSDVVGGAVIGIATGMVGRLLVNRLDPSPARPVTDRTAPKGMGGSHRRL